MADRQSSAKLKATLSNPTTMGKFERIQPKLSRKICRSFHKDSPPGGCDQGRERSLEVGSRSDSFKVRISGYSKSQIRLWNDRGNLSLRYRTQPERTLTSFRTEGARNSFFSSNSSTTRSAVRLQAVFGDKKIDGSGGCDSSMEGTQKWRPENSSRLFELCDDQSLI